MRTPDPAAELLAGLCAGKFVLLAAMRKAVKVFEDECWRMNMFDPVELGKLLDDFPEEIARMRRCLHVAGRDVPDRDIAFAWTRYSKKVAACWLSLADSDDELTRIVIEHLPFTGRDPWIRHLDTLGRLFHQMRTKQRADLAGTARRLGVSPNSLQRCEAGEAITTRDLLQIVEGWGLAMLVIPQPECARVLAALGVSEPAM